MSQGADSVPDFGIMLKSYSSDLHYAKRFLESFMRFATEPIPLFVVVPERDVHEFSDVFGSNATILSESLWEDQLVDYPIHGNNPGYINQEIIKLAFAEKGFLKNYLCADSEAVFIRPFSIQDFMDPSGISYTFITEDAELHVDPTYYVTYWQSRDKYLKRIRQFLDLPLEPLATCHNMAVFSSDSVMSLKEFLSQKGVTWAGAMEIAPYEFSWYNFWTERTLGKSRITREPIVLMLHQPHQHLEYSLKRVKQKDLARGYVAVLVNSGFAQDHGVIDFEEPLSETLSRYVSYRNLAGAAFERLFIRAPRLRRLLGGTKTS